MCIMGKRQFHTGTVHAAVKTDISVNVSVCGGISFCRNSWIQMWILELEHSQLPSLALAICCPLTWVLDLKLASKAHLMFPEKPSGTNVLCLKYSQTTQWNATQWRNMCASCLCNFSFPRCSWIQFSHLQQFFSKKKQPKPLPSPRYYTLSNKYVRTWYILL